ncbi:hypothetical protein JCM10213v2_006425 [Rhodosporidiobolus nylandii]
MAPPSSAHLATRAIHADAAYAGDPVSPAISTSTTFRHPTLEQQAAAPPGHYDVDWNPHNPSRHIYSRETQPVGTRVEKVLSDLIGGPTLIYSSGIAACFAILLHVRPDVIAVTGGYFGCHGSFDIYRRTRGTDQVSIIALDDEYPKDKKVLVWLETPLNPTGESRSIAAYSKKAKDVGATLAVDATFAPPPLQEPFKWGADIIMHSGTKHFGGHSDLLAGTVTVKSEEEWHQLFDDRVHTGSNAGSLDTWLLLRSLRTLNLRIQRQAVSGTALAHYLHSLTGPDAGDLAGVIKTVWHTALQDDADQLIGEDKQLAVGPACFGFLTTTPQYAMQLAESLTCFIHATSLGGVESLVEVRIISDSKCDPCLIRVSVGVEDVEDLKADFAQAIRKTSKAPSAYGA